VSVTVCVCVCDCVYVFVCVFSVGVVRTDDKTSRLKMKSFSTVRDTQRGSQRYMEKRRGRRVIEVTRRRRGGIKRGESKLASNHFLMGSPQSGSLRDVHGVIQRRQEGGKRQRWPGGYRGE